MNITGRPFVVILLAVSMLLAVATGQAAPALGPLGSRVIAAAEAPFHGLTIEDADPAGALRWAAWGEGTAGAQMVRLALLNHGAAGGALWAMSWPDAYDPGIQPTPEWRFAGHPVLALTMQFGAAAEQIDLFGLDSENHPVRLAEKLAAAIGWSVNASGDLVMIVYSLPASALVPACFGWNSSANLLMPVGC
jgi:hypothetical protein